MAVDPLEALAAPPKPHPLPVKRRLDPLEALASPTPADPFAALATPATAVPSAPSAPAARDPFAALAAPAVPKVAPPPVSRPPKPTYEVAMRGDKTPRRENPLRTAGEYLSLAPSLAAAAFDSLPASDRFRAEQARAGYVPDQGALGKAIEMLRTQGPGAVNDYFDPFGAASTLRHHPGKPLPPLPLQLTGEFGEQLVSPENDIAGGVAGAALRMAGRGIGTARAASPVLDDSLTALGGAASDAARPFRRAGAAALKPLAIGAKRAVDVVAKAPGIGPTVQAARELVSRYGQLRSKGGTPYVGAGLAIQAAPEHAVAQVRQRTNEIFRDLTAAQKREVQKLSYVDEDGNPLATRDASVPEPKNGHSLETRARMVRSDLINDDAEQEALGIRAGDKGELYDSGSFFPMKQFGDREVYNAPELNAAAKAGDDVALVNAIRKGGVRGRSAFSAGVTKAGHKINATIVEPGVEERLSVDYDPAHQYQEHRIETRKAIANEQQRRELASVPSIDPATGKPRVWTPPKPNVDVDGSLLPAQPEALNARVPLQYVLPRKGGNVYLGEGQEGAAKLKKYIDATARLKAAAAARRDPEVLAVAAKNGIDPALLGTRRVTAQNMAPFNARVQEVGRSSMRVARGLQGAAVDVQRAARQRALANAKVVARLDKAKRALVLGNDAVGEAIRNNGALREALSSNVASQRQAAEEALDEIGRVKEAIAQQRPGVIRGVAGGMRDDVAVAQQPFWDALNQVGGKITPDMVWDAGKKRFRLAGEFADMPRSLLKPAKAIEKPERGERIPGNIDEVTAIVRKTHPGITEDEVREFFARNPRPPRPGDFADDARERVLAEILPKYHGAGADQVAALRDELGAARRSRELAAAEARGASKATGTLANAVAQLRTAAARSTGAAGAIDATAEHLAAGANATKGETAALERIGAIDRAQRVRLDVLHDRADVAAAKAETATAFQAAKADYFRELYDAVKQSVEQRSVKMPEGYTREGDLGIASPSGKHSAIDDAFANFYKSGERLSAHESEQAKSVWKTMQTFNRLARASIVLFPQVHAVNNLGMAYLAEGGDPVRMGEIIAGRAKFDPDVEARALKAGAINEHAVRAFGGASAHEATAPAAELGNEAARKLDPFYRPADAGVTQSAETPLGQTTMTVGATPEQFSAVGKAVAGARRAGVEFDRKVYQPMNDWLFGNVERGYGIDLFDRFTKAGMSDGEAAIRVRNALGNYGDISAMERAANLDRIFYFYPWMKTVVSYWSKKGVIDPKWWEAPERAIEVNNKSQGYDDPSRPFTATLGHRADGSWRRAVLPLPQRVLENVAEAARVPVDVARGNVGDALDDANAPINYLRGHLNLPLSVLMDTFQAGSAAGRGGRLALPPGNFYAPSDGENAPTTREMLERGVTRAIAPLETASRLGADPLGVAAGYASGSFTYGTPTAAQRHRMTEVNRFFSPLIAQAKKAGNAALVQRLVAARAAAIAGRPKPQPLPVRPSPAPVPAPDPLEALGGDAKLDPLQALAK